MTKNERIADLEERVAHLERVIAGAREWKEWVPPKQPWAYPIDRSMFNPDGSPKVWC